MKKRKVRISEGRSWTNGLIPWIQPRHGKVLLKLSASSCTLERRLPDIEAKAAVARSTLEKKWFAMAEKQLAEATNCETTSIARNFRRKNAKQKSCQRWHVGKPRSTIVDENGFKKWVQQKEYFRNGMSHANSPPAALRYFDHHAPHNEPPKSFDLALTPLKKSVPSHGAWNLTRYDDAGWAHATNFDSSSF